MSFFRAVGVLQRTAQSNLRPGTSNLRQSLLSNPALFHTSIARLALSADARKKIDEAVNAHDVVVFMKGTPDLPMCGFSRGCSQLINDVYQVPKSKLK
jgi:monothiol glutaredoxin